MNQNLVFQVWRNGRFEEEVIVQQGMTLGCDERNSVRAEGVGVMPLHARVLRQTDGAFELVCENYAPLLLDYGSGRAVARLTLDDRVRVMLGNVQLLCCTNQKSSVAPVGVNHGLSQLQVMPIEADRYASADFAQVIPSVAPREAAVFEEEALIQPAPQVKKSSQRLIAFAIVLLCLVGGMFALYHYSGYKAGDFECNRGESYTAKGNQVVAAEWYRKAAEKGHAKAQLEMALRYQNGVGVTQDHQQSLQWFRKCAEQGNAEAQYALAVIYAVGRVTDKNADEAVKWCQQAAENGHAKAQVEIGILYHKGISFQQDFTKAVQWFTKAANQGDAVGQYYLASYYAAGTGVPKDQTQALAWFRKAAKQGHQGSKQELAKRGVSE